MSRDCAETIRFSKWVSVAAAIAASLFIACVAPEKAIAQQIVQCHSGGTGTIPECQQRDAQSGTGSEQIVQCHSGGSGTIPECQQRDAQAGMGGGQIVQCHSGGTGTIPECQQRDAQSGAGTNQIVQCHSGGTGTIPQCQQRDAQTGLGSNQVVQCHSGGTETILECQQRDAQTGSSQIVQCHSGGTGTIPQCQQRDAQSGAIVQCHSGGTGTIPQCQQRDAQAGIGSSQVVQCHSGGSGTIPECQQRDAQLAGNRIVQCHSGGSGTVAQCQQRDAQAGSGTQPTLNLPNGGQFLQPTNPNPLASDSAWLAQLPSNYRQQVLSLPASQITAMKQNGTWLDYQRNINAAIARDMAPTSGQLLSGTGGAIAGSIDPNKLIHLFDPAQGHNLEPVVKEFGSEERAFEAIEAAIQRVVTERGLVGELTEVAVVVGRYTVLVSGIVINGVAKIGTAYIPP